MTCEARPITGDTRDLQISIMKRLMNCRDDPIVNILSSVLLLTNQSYYFLMSQLLYQERLCNVRSATTPPPPPPPEVMKVHVPQ